MKRPQLLELYRVMLTAREVDRIEQEMTGRGEAFFTVSGAGHESTAVLARHLTADDWLHCHYRDKALMIARGIAPKAFLDAVLCNDNSHSRGRQMSAMMCDARWHVLSMVTPVANNALQSAGVAVAVKDLPSAPIVLCSVGDGSTQQGEFLEACGEAAREQLPVLFLIEDNEWSISTRTAGKTFYSLPQGKPSHFHGVAIHHVNGRDVIEADARLGEIVATMRRDRQPMIVVFHVERLVSHTNADDETLYRDPADIRRAAETGDPILLAEKRLAADGCPESLLEEIRRGVRRDVAAAETEALAGPDPKPIFEAKRAIPVELTHPSKEFRGDTEAEEQLTMKDAMRDVLRHHLKHDRRVSLFGQDIEDPKGDVFGVTRGLSSEFPQRVRNAPLTESTILGVSIGRALAGERPVAFLQFADFLPLAFNQITNELGSMFWRTDGAYSVPLIIMIPCGAYRAGLGPFHAQTMDSLSVHIPGVDVFMPSTAGDAAGLLNAAFASERPTMLFYPKSCLNDPLNTTSTDVEKQFTPIGPARKARSGRDITFVGWGNTVRLCEKAADTLERAGIEAEVIDLRSLSPWDKHAVLASVEKTARLVVVHEDNHSCGLGGEVMATVAELARVPVAMRRVTRPDTYVPCNFANQIDVLPSFKSVLTTAAELLDLDLTWRLPEQPKDNLLVVEAVGSGPSDESVEVVEFFVKPGEQVERGDPLASLEATKSVFELTSPSAGTIEDLLAAEGDSIAVGAPLLTIRGTGAVHRKAVSQEQSGTPRMTRRATRERLRVPRHESQPRQFEVGISSVSIVTGSRTVTNADLLNRDASMTSDDVIRRTGIECRHWAAEGEDAVSMAVRACWKVLDREQLTLDDIDLVICSTTSPTVVTPSMACQVLAGLAGGRTDAMAQAYDINAACSGYLYALQSGFDYLQSMPQGRVLIVTAEVLSPLLNMDDLDTAILFGDASSASVLYGEAHFQKSTARLLRPDLSARAEDGSTLSVPLLHDGYIQMKGRKVFSEAVRAMIASLTRACDHGHLGVDDLNMVIPHQANQRIIDAISQRIGANVYSNIRYHGNTSSTSIPLCLSEVLPKAQKGNRLGLCAFGGGFTFGAGILEVV